ncbi:MULTISPECIES: cytochrome C [Sphingobacterium]|uniref:cytochrome C n=1 Tax=Sphingobacterium TaxID=28453 RepID=UPI001623C9B3|nr:MULTISPECIES: cytochrome C [Sphingobacterium]MBV2226934.1 cytochrome C [Sphingobacterium mizutaii]
MSQRSKIFIFIDDEKIPIAETYSPVNFELDTRKLVDGKHQLRIVSQDPGGKEGVRIIPFEVRNGPAIEITGIKENAVIDDLVPIMINAYGKGNSETFMIDGSETPQGIPWWVWIIIIVFMGWAMYYVFMYLYLPTSVN